jgi:predicted transcriptional regulator
MTTDIDRNELLELEILNHIEDSPKQTTRLLASKIGCNLRLTHALLKKLIEKGMLDVKKINSRNWHYYLTPKGIAEKASKTYKFFEFSMHFYQQARELSSALCARLKEEGADKVAFFGCGHLAEIAYLSLQENNLTLMEVYGNTGNEFMGRPLLPFEKAVDSGADALIVCVYNRKHPKLKILDSIGEDKVKRIFH